MLRKPAEFLKLISRLDSLCSDGYKSKVADKYPKLFEGQLLYHTQRRCQTFPSVNSKEGTLPLVSETKEELDRMLETGDISRVDQPTDWYAPMVVAPKSNGKVRVCVDLAS